MQAGYYQKEKLRGIRSMARKSQHCLFIEEEIYNWASPKSAKNRRLLYLALLFLTAGLLFSVLR